ncbi:hypothetical protein [Methanobrevibacter sp.]|uniref:hypothetical protein n=1 Tax=Methanobrevibacter sp. TaxID=66852 RepID=UPI003865E45A
MDDKKEDDEKKKSKISYVPDPKLRVMDEFGHDSNKSCMFELEKIKKNMKKENNE